MIYRKYFAVMLMLFCLGCTRLGLGSDRTFRQYMGELDGQRTISSLTAAERGVLCERHNRFTEVGSTNFYCNVDGVVAALNAVRAAPNRSVCEQEVSACLVDPARNPKPRPVASSCAIAVVDQLTNCSAPVRMLVRCLADVAEASDKSQERVSCSLVNGAQDSTELEKRINEARSVIDQDFELKSCDDLDRKCPGVIKL